MVDQPHFVPGRIPDTAQPTFRMIAEIGYPALEGERLPGVLPPAPAGAAVFGPLRQVVREWLTDKGVAEDTPLSSGLHDLGDSRMLAVASTFADDGEEAAVRIRLEEGLPSGAWRTTVTACRPDALPGALRSPTEKRPLLSVELTCADLGVEVRPQPPRLMRYLLESLPLCDGPARLTSEPLLVHAEREEEMAELVEVLTRRDRRPVLVAARPPQPNHLWHRRWNDISKRAAGASALFLLADQAAVDRFEEAVYPPFRVAPGAVRTFLPEVDPAWTPDASRHRVLSYRRLRDADDQAWHNIAASVQTWALSTPVPGALSRADFPGLNSGALATAERARRDALQAATEAATMASDTDTAREEINLLTGLLEEADTLIRDLGADRDRTAAQATASAAALRQSVEDLELTALEHAEAQADVDRLETEVQRLRLELLRLGHGGAAFTVTTPVKPPDSFEELLDRLPDLPHLKFMGDRRATLALDDSNAPSAPVWAAKAWRALRTLNSYAEHSLSPDGFAGNVYEFCRNPPVGAATWPLTQLAMTESATVQDQWATERMLPVPTTINPTGKIMMKAHLKLGSKGSIAPRIYFHDATSTPVAKMIIGRIGKHLTNTRT